MNNYIYVSIVVFRETNLKCKQCIPEIAVLQHDVTSFDGEIICEPPNNLLNKFTGTLLYKEKR